MNTITAPSTLKPQYTPDLVILVDLLLRSTHGVAGDEVISLTDLWSRQYLRHRLKAIMVA